MMAIDVLFKIRESIQGRKEDPMSYDQSRQPRYVNSYNILCGLTYKRLIV